MHVLDEVKMKVGSGGGSQSLRDEAACHIGHGVLAASNCTA